MSALALSSSIFSPPTSTANVLETFLWAILNKRTSNRRISPPYTATTRKKLIYELNKGINISFTIHSTKLIYMTVLNCWPRAVQLISNMFPWLQRLQITQCLRIFRIPLKTKWYLLKILKMSKCHPKIVKDHYKAYKDFQSWPKDFKPTPVNYCS